MTNEEIRNKLTEIFREVLGDNSLILSDELTAKDVEQWDSLSHMLLITEIESLFSIKLKLKDLNKMRNVGDMINIINSKF